MFFSSFHTVKTTVLPRGGCIYIYISPTYPLLWVGLGVGQRTAASRPDASLSVSILRGKRERLGGLLYCSGSAVEGQILCTFS